MPALKTQPSPDIVRAEQRLGDLIGAPVRLRHNPNTGEGQVDFQFFQLGDLINLLERMGDNHG